MSRNVFLNKNGILWTIKINYSEDVLKYLEYLELEGKDLCDSGDVVKSNSARSVRTIKIEPNINAYFKHFKIRKFLDVFKNTVIGSKARNEWLNATKILKKGVRIGEPVAFGEKQTNFVIKDNFLIVKAVENSVSLKELLQDKLLQGKYFIERKVILKSLSLFVNDLHLKGILHNDLHLGNILVPLKITTSLKNSSANTYDSVKNSFSLIDLHDVKCKENISIRAKINNFAFILYSLTFCCSRSEINKVINEYLAYSFKSDERKQIRRKINNLIISIRRRHLFSRTKRCLKNSSKFAKKIWVYGRDQILQEGRYKVFFNRDYNKNVLVNAIADHISAIKNSSEFIIKESSRTFITAVPVKNGSDGNVVPDNSSGRKICVKEIKNHGIFKQLRETLFFSRSKKAWYAGNGFVVRNCPTPVPIAMVEKTGRSLVKSSFILTEYINDAIPSYIYVRDSLEYVCNKAENSFASKRTFIETFARSFSNLHKSNIYHADLKGGNVLVKEINNHEWEFYYVDLDRVFFKKKIKKNCIIKNLIQLNASLPNAFSFADRMRFFKSYSNLTRLTVNDKSIIREIVKASIKRNHFWDPVGW